MGDRLRRRLTFSVCNSHQGRLSLLPSVWASAFGLDTRRIRFTGCLVPIGLYRRACGSSRLTWSKLPKVGDCLAPWYSWREPSELWRWFCHINTVLVIRIIIKQHELTQWTFVTAILNMYLWRYRWRACKLCLLWWSIENDRLTRRDDELVWDLYSYRLYRLRRQLVLGYPVYNIMHLRNKYGKCGKLYVSNKN